VYYPQRKVLCFWIACYESFKSDPRYKVTGYSDLHDAEAVLMRIKERLNMKRKMKKKSTIVSQFTI